jgi:hypothetical protein
MRRKKPRRTTATSAILNIGGSMDVSPSSGIV